MTVPKNQSDPTVQTPGNGRPLQLGFGVTEMNFFFCVCVCCCCDFRVLFSAQDPCFFYSR
ncbi:hypothetical protein HanXRQr2_Chr17g0820781 [Helianthus annuus]|uniref:Uncharacterized protein n=1 Tax=Helianthus annuus TaxID=4232 RepID=A0A9K3DKV2_HELAN|nr:hypothetical protein HanXRQr2_Chr17g0820781 [Helianthus annuus]